MHQIISLVLFIIGIVLIFAPDYIVSKDTTNENMKMIYEYRQVLGGGCVALAYYFYTLQKKEGDIYTIDPLETTKSKSVSHYTKSSDK
jgi:hypothetical protein